MLGQTVILSSFTNVCEEAPVMWLPGEGGMSGFWSVTHYEDIKQVELAHNVFAISTRRH